MNFGAKDQNSMDYKLCFDIQLALVSFSYQNHSSLPNLSLVVALEMLCYQQNWEFFGANIRREKESVLRFWVTTLKEYDLNCVSVISVCYGRPWIWRSNSICLPVFWPSMGSKSRKKPRLIERVTEGSLSSRGTSKKKGYSSSWIFVEIQRALSPTETRSATTEESFSS